MGTVTSLLWTGMLFTGAMVADILSSGHFPYYVVAIVAGIGLGFLLSGLLGDRDEEEPLCPAGCPCTRWCALADELSEIKVPGPRKDDDS